MKPILISLLILAIHSVQSQESLKLVHVFFRHGSRTPEQADTYPNDPYTLYDFQPMGYGQLTNIGKKGAYQLGKMLRGRYDSFLGKIYTAEIVETISTDYDRTKMSALLVLAGLFPPHPSQRWTEELPWLPIPYYFDKYKQDYFIRRPALFCPAYAEALKKAEQSPEQQNLTKQYEGVYDYITHNSGRQTKNLLDALYMYQTLNAENNMNLTLPEWTKKVYPEPLTTLTGLRLHLEMSYNDMFKRLNGGRSLKKVIDHMKEKVDGKLVPQGRKIFLYSGHESNVANVFAAMNVFTPHVPKYSSAAIFELHYFHEKKIHAVKVFYAREVGQDPIEMKIPGCDKDCKLDKFLEVTKNYIPGNYTEECQATENLGD